MVDVESSLSRNSRGLPQIVSAHLLRLSRPPVLATLLASLLLCLGCGDKGPTEFGGDPIIPGGDRRAPEIMSFDYLPKSVDVTRAAQLVNVEAFVCDEADGVLNAISHFRAPSQAAITGFFELELAEGDEFCGTYRAGFVVPLNSESGIWRITFLRAEDKKANVRLLETEDMIQRGFPVELRVTSIWFPSHSKHWISIAPRHSTPSIRPEGQAAGSAGRSWILPSSEATSILMITAGMPPLMSMLNSERWLCIDARLFSQNRLTRCLKQW